MCEAILGIRNEGRMQNLIELVCKKIVKNKSVEEIADMLEESPETIRRIYDVAVKYAPEYDVVSIYSELEK